MENQSVRDRLNSYIKYLGISQRKFEITIGKANGFVGSVSDSISKAALNVIVEKFPQLNPIWLMFGEGEMLKTETKSETKTETETEQKENPDTIIIGESEDAKKLGRLNYALKTAMQSKGLFKKTDFAKELQMNYPYLCQITTGKENLTESFLLTLQKKLDINPDYILKGEGSIFLHSKTVEPTLTNSEFTASEPETPYQVRIVDSENYKSDTPKLLNVAMESLGKESLREYSLRHPEQDANIISLVPGFKFLYRIRTTSVEPYGLLQEDYICLDLVEDKDTLICGKVYFVDSTDNGKMVKRLSVQQDCYVLSSPNSGNEEQIIKIPKTATVDFYRIVLRITTNTDKLFSERSADMYYMAMAAVEANKGLIINERKAHDNVKDAEQNTKHALSIIDQLINK